MFIWASFHDIGRPGRDGGRSPATSGGSEVLATQGPGRSSLESASHKYFVGGLAEGTRRSYSSAQKRYVAFCTGQNLQPLPLEEGKSCLFATYLAEQGLSPQTVNYLVLGSYTTWADCSRPGHPPDITVASTPLHCQGYQTVTVRAPATGTAPDYSHYSEEAVCHLGFGERRDPIHGTAPVGSLLLGIFWFSQIRRIHGRQVVRPTRYLCFGCCSGQPELPLYY